MLPSAIVRTLNIVRTLATDLLRRVCWLLHLPGPYRNSKLQNIYLYIDIKMAKQTNNIASISSVALLQHEALHILSQLDKKPIIAIDLDYTVSNYINT